MGMATVASAPRESPTGRGSRSRAMKPPPTSPTSSARWSPSTHHAAIGDWVIGPISVPRSAGPISGARCLPWSRCKSEGGAAGALHGALQSGALATTVTASRGRLSCYTDGHAATCDGCMDDALDASRIWW